MCARVYACACVLGGPLSPPFPTSSSLQFHVAILERVAKGEAEEEEKKTKHAATIKIMAVSRKEQVDEVRAKKAAEKREADAIGEAIKQQAKQQQQQDYEAAVAKQIRIAESNAALVIANEKLIAVRAVIKVLILPIPIPLFPYPLLVLALTFV